MHSINRIDARLLVFFQRMSDHVLEHKRRDCFDLARRSQIIFFVGSICAVISFFKLNYMLVGCLSIFAYLVYFMNLSKAIFERDTNFKINQLNVVYEEVLCKKRKKAYLPVILFTAALIAFLFVEYDPRYKEMYGWMALAVVSNFILHASYFFGLYFASCLPRPSKKS